MRRLALLYTYGVIGAAIGVGVYSLMQPEIPQVPRTRAGVAGGLIGNGLVLASVMRIARRP